MGPLLPEVPEEVAVRQLDPRQLLGLRVPRPEEQGPWPLFVLALERPPHQCLEEDVGQQAPQVEACLGDEGFEKLLEEFHRQLEQPVALRVVDHTPLGSALPWPHHEVVVRLLGELPRLVPRHLVLARCESR